MYDQTIMRELPRMLQTSWVKSANDMLSIEFAVSTQYYLSCTDYRSQCHSLYNILHIFGFSKNKIAMLLGVDHKSFEKQLSLPLESRPNGRPSILTQDEKEVLFEKNNDYHRNQIKPTL